MSRPTIGNIISRVRNQVKASRQDTFLTDRVLYSFILKHAQWLMKREDSKSKLLGFNSVIQTLEFVELIEVDKVMACCTGIKSDIMIKRTKEKMPTFMQGYWGPLIRTIASLDGSEELQPILPSTFIRMANSKNFKFNKTKYYWFLDDYIYFPNIDWDAVRVEGIFQDDIEKFTCADDACIEKSSQPFNVPDYLYGELEASVLKDLGMMAQFPPDMPNDKQNALR
jgi:hypothetical protein